MSTSVHHSTELVGTAGLREKFQVYIGSSEPLSRPVLDLDTTGKLRIFNDTFNGALGHLPVEAFANVGDHNFPSNSTVHVDLESTEVAVGLPWARKFQVLPGMKVSVRNNIGNDVGFGFNPNVRGFHGITASGEVALFPETTNVNDKVPRFSKFIGLMHSGTNTHESTRSGGKIGTNGIGIKAINAFSVGTTALAFHKESGLVYFGTWQRMVRHKFVLMRVTGDDFEIVASHNGSYTSQKFHEHCPSFFLPGRCEACVVDCSPFPGQKSKDFDIVALAKETFFNEKRTVGASASFFRITYFPDVYCSKFIQNHHKFNSDTFDHVEPLLLEVEKVTVAEMYRMAIREVPNIMFNGKKIDGQKLMRESVGDILFDTPKPLPLSPDTSVFPPASNNITFTIWPKPGIRLGYVNKSKCDDGLHFVMMREFIEAALISLLTEEMKCRLPTFPAVLAAEVKKAKIDNHLSTIVSINMTNPSFVSQKKESLSSVRGLIAGKRCVPDPTTVALIVSAFKSSKAADSLLSELKRAVSSILNPKIVLGDVREIVKVVPAAWAGKERIKRRKKTNLWLIEGDSASALPKHVIGHTVDKFNTNGIYGLRGKIPNVWEMDFQDVMENKRIRDLVTILGLPTDFTKDVDLSSLTVRRSTLNYDTVVIATDADVDGSHIKGLVLALFTKFWPGLLNNFIVCFRSPIVRIYQGSSIVRRIYDSAEAELAANDPRHSGHTIRYYKGLGTSDGLEALDDVRNPRFTQFVSSDDSVVAAVDAFGKKTQARKEGIARHTSGETSCVDGVELLESQTCPIDIQQKCTLEVSSTSLVMRQGVIGEYGGASIIRAIPDVRDGLKQSWRQIIDSVLRMPKSSIIDKAMPGVIFNAEIIKMTHYHHGETSMYETCVGLLRHFPTGNNICIGNGVEFGTRMGAGTDRPAMRYSVSRVHPFIHTLFPPELHKLVPRRKVEGFEVEAEWIPCIIPFSLVNGIRGIASGWKSSIPPHHPIAVIDTMIAHVALSIKEKTDEQREEFASSRKSFTMKIPQNFERVNTNSQKFEEEVKKIEESEQDVIKTTSIPLLPWIRGFTGTISFDAGSSSWYTSGDVTVSGKDVILSEIPVGMTHESFKNKLIPFLTTNKSPDHPHFITNITWTGVQEKSSFIVSLKDDTKETLALFFKHAPLVERKDCEFILHENTDIVKMDGAVQLISSHFSRMNEMFKTLQRHKLMNIKDEVGVLTKRMAVIRIYLDNIDKLHGSKAGIPEGVIDKLFGEMKSVFMAMKISDFTEKEIARLNTVINNKKKMFGLIKKTHHNVPFLISLWKLRKELLEMKHSGKGDFDIREDDVVAVESIASMKERLRMISTESVEPETIQPEAE